MHGVILIAIFLGLLAGCAGPDPFPCDLETSGEAYPTVNVWNIDQTEVTVALVVEESGRERRLTLAGGSYERIVLQGEGPGNRTMRLSSYGTSLAVVYPMNCPLEQLNFELQDGGITSYWSGA